MKRVGKANLVFTIMILLLGMAGTVGAQVDQAEAESPRPSYWMIKAGLHFPGELYFEPAEKGDPPVGPTLGIAYSTPFGQQMRIGGFFDWHHLREDVPLAIFGVEVSWDSRIKVRNFRFQPGLGVGMGFFGGGYEIDDSHLHLSARLITEPTEKLGWLLELKLALLGAGGYKFVDYRTNDPLLSFRAGMVF